MGPSYRGHFHSLDDAFEGERVHPLVTFFETVLEIQEFGCVLSGWKSVFVSGQLLSYLIGHLFEKALSSLVPGIQDSLDAILYFSYCAFQIH